MRPVTTPPHLPIHVPILRAGRYYTSQDQLDLTDYATGQVVARVQPGQPRP